jgi:iron complex outermembrane receptor protein
MKFQKTHNFEYNESFPFTPPLSGNLSFVYASEYLKSVLSADLAGEQNDISYSILTEDATDAYAVVNFRNSYSFNDDLRLRIGVVNLFDELFHTHFSINNLPNPGRNFYLGLSLGL